MASSAWDPYRTLNIISKEDQDMLCVGRRAVLWNAGCRCQIPSQKVADIHALMREMALEPPEEASSKLRQLAQLALCDQYHQDQKTEVTAQWKKLIGAAAEDYQVAQQLRSENERLLDCLGEERRERVRLQALLEKHDDSDSTTSETSDGSDIGPAQLYQEIEALRTKLNMSIREAGRHEKNFQVAEATRKTLSTRVEYLEAMYAKRDREADNLKQTLEEQKEDFAIQMEEERQTLLNVRKQLQEHREHFQKANADQTTLIETLQSEMHEKSRLLDQRLIEVREKTELCANLAKQMGDSNDRLIAERATTLELRKNMERLTSSEVDLKATVENLEAQLASEKESMAKLESDANAAREAEAQSAQDLETFRAQFLDEHQTLRNELDQVIKRRTELLEEVDSMKSSARQSMAKFEHDLAAAIKEHETLEAERNSLQSALSSERHCSVRFNKDLEDSKAAQNVLVDEINLLRAQLETEREGRSILDNALIKLKIEKYKLRAELQEQTETAEKLDLLLTTTKEQEAYLAIQMAGIQTALRQAQVDQSRSRQRTEELIALRPLHVKVVDAVKYVATQNPQDLYEGLKFKLAPFAQRTTAWASSLWHSVTGAQRSPSRSEDLEVWPSVRRTTISQERAALFLADLEYPRAFRSVRVVWRLQDETSGVCGSPSSYPGKLLQHLYCRKALHCRILSRNLHFLVRDTQVVATLMASLHWAIFRPIRTADTIPQPATSAPTNLAF